MEAREDLTDDLIDLLSSSMGSFSIGASPGGQVPCFLGTFLGIEFQEKFNA
jgi:hypothetical protein